jgi:hypothetical protein
MVDTTWNNASADGKASTAGNWSNGIGEGYNVLFDHAVSDANCTWDLAVTLGTFTMGTGYAGVVTQSEDFGCTDFLMQGGTVVGSATKWMNNTISFSRSAGTITNLRLHSFNSTVNYFSSSTTLWFTGNCVLTHNNAYLSYLVVDSGSTVTFTGIGYCLVTGIPSNTISLSGNFICTNGGRLECDLQSTNKYININGYVTKLRLTARFNTASNVIFSLSDDMNIGILEVLSGHATYTGKLDLAGYSLTCTSLTVSTRGVLLGGEGTITVNGGAFNSSAGTFTKETSTVVLNGASTIKTNGTDEFHNLITTDIRTLASNVTIGHYYVHARDEVLAGFTLSLTDATLERNCWELYPVVNPVVNPVMTGTNYCLRYIGK